MTDPYQTWIQRLGQWSPAGQAFALSSLFVTFLAASAPLGLMIYGQNGAIAAAAATGVCLLAGWIAMLATHLLSSPEKPTTHLILGMMFRMGLPLAVCLVLVQQDHWLMTYGFGFFLVAAFTVGLTVETLFTLSRLKVDDLPIDATQTPNVPTSPSP